MPATVLPTQVPSLIIPVTGKNLLVPNSCVAEIVANVTTRKEESAPEWVMGMVTWRELPLPCVSIEHLLGGSEAHFESATRIAIFNTLSPSYEKRFYGIAITGIPRLARVTEQELIMDEDECGEYEKLHVQLNGEACIVPNLENIERLLTNSGL